MLTLTFEHNERNRYSDVKDGKELFGDAPVVAGEELFGDPSDAICVRALLDYVRSFEGFRDQWHGNRRQVALTEAQLRDAEALGSEQRVKNLEKRAQDLAENGQMITQSGAWAAEQARGAAHEVIERGVPLTAEAMQEVEKSRSIFEAETLEALRNLVEDGSSNGRR